MSQSCRVAARERERYEFVFWRLWTFRSTWQRRPIDWTLVKRPITWVKVAPSLIELFLCVRFRSILSTIFFLSSNNFHSIWFVCSLLCKFYANEVRGNVWNFSFEKIDFVSNSTLIRFLKFLTILKINFMQIHANLCKWNAEIFLKNSMSSWILL